MKVYLVKITFILLVTGIVHVSCNNLEVENLNKPDLLKALSNSEDVYNYAGSLFKNLHNALHEYESPMLAMGGMADQTTCSWGTASLYDLSKEPRRGFNNSVNYPYRYFIEGLWENCYEIITDANIILELLNNSEVQENKGMKPVDLKAWCYFITGIAYGYLGLVFDQAHIVHWDSEIDELELSPWQDVVDTGLVYLDESILLLQNQSFNIPPEWMGGVPFTNEELSELANSYAARILVSSSRNKKHNEATNWNQVLKYARNGIQTDFSPVIGDAFDFYVYSTIYQIYPGWGRIDHRIINLMDPDYPSRWPDDGLSWNTPDGSDPGPAKSKDARLETDFEFLTDNNYRPERGYYFFSHYRYKRYDDLIGNVWYGDKPQPDFLVWENEILKAEALLRTGILNGALDIINNPEGARKIRGHLPDLITSNYDEVLWAIFYERDIELINTGLGIGYFDMRRRDQLQRGTILHFPVPAAELAKMNIENYTIEGSPDGENISKGSWTGLDGLTSPLW